MKVHLLKYVDMLLIQEPVGNIMILGIWQTNSQ